jgi:hypothetical protein
MSATSQRAHGDRVQMSRRSAQTRQPDLPELRRRSLLHQCRVRMEQRQHPNARLTLLHGFSDHTRLSSAGTCSQRLRNEPTPERDRRWKADVTTDLYVTSDPCFSTGFLRAPVSAAGCSCCRYQQEHFLSKRVPPVPVENVSSDAFRDRSGFDEVAVGTIIADRPPHRSARALTSACGSYLG